MKTVEEDFVYSSWNSPHTSKRPKRGAVTPPPCWNLSNTTWMMGQYPPRYRPPHPKPGTWCRGSAAQCTASAPPPWCGSWQHWSAAASGPRGSQSPPRCPSGGTALYLGTSPPLSPAPHYGKPKGELRKPVQGERGRSFLYANAG